MKSGKLLFQMLISGSIVVGFLVSVGFASHKQNNMPCTGLNISITDSSGFSFVEESDIRQTIQNKFGSLVGNPLASINMPLLEKIINTNPFISAAEVFSTIDGKINIEVKQRVAVLRVINYKNESFYIDKEGFFMPTSEKYTARVPLANGFIYDVEAEKRIRIDTTSGQTDSTGSNSKLEQLFNIICFVNHNEFWNAQLQQLYVNPEFDIEMIPRVGNQTIVLGDDKFLDDKFIKLKAFYEQELNKSGWNRYTKINLKYKDLVVCTKK